MASYMNGCEEAVVTKSFFHSGRGRNVEIVCIVRGTAICFCLSVGMGTAEIKSTNKMSPSEKY